MSFDIIDMLLIAIMGVGLGAAIFGSKRIEKEMGGKGEE